MSKYPIRHAYSAQRRSAQQVGGAYDKLTLLIGWGIAKPLRELSSQLTPPHVP